jgi:branched-chain amino acid transport system substrate-binding protein
VIFSQTFDSESQHERYLRFKAQFLERFGTEPDFAAALGYEAAQILLDALSRTKKMADLKDMIINRAFQGLQGEMTMDQYGDIIWKSVIVTVKNGQFMTME